MQKEVTFDLWYAVETSEGTEYIPFGVIASFVMTAEEAMEEVGHFCEGVPESVSVKVGYGARLSGLESTEWTIHDTKEKARQYLDEVYG